MPAQDGLRDAVAAPEETRVRAIGHDLMDAIGRRPIDPVGRAEQLMTQAISRDPRLRAALFRFVDVRPACRTRREVAQHLVALLDDAHPAGRTVAAATSLGRRRRTRAIVAVAAERGVAHMAHRFIVGESIAHALPTLEGLWSKGVASSVDLLGEAAVSEHEADAYSRRCASALEGLAERMSRWPMNPTLERGVERAPPRVNLSVKITALTPQIRADAPERGVRGAADRLRALLRLARDRGAHLHIDKEALDSRETVLSLVMELLGEAEFHAGPSAGIVLQAYLRDSPDELDLILDWARAHDRAIPLTVRLVKGAYWDHELVEARQHGWRVPVFQSRAECDRNFELLTRRLIAAAPVVRLAVASHNVRSIAHALACAPAQSARPELEFQVLRGLGDDIQDALAAMGLRVRTYCPVGDLIEGMAYLVRRLLENTANDSFLAARAGGQDIDELLAPP